ncbi:MAG: UDP-N-acetylmuramoyl-L-alanyl-D-glutamate--2,6-diaminopimelate ligase [Oscillospiraceae bacterium]|nr:UDP-N-acetylmuramoyl-L-alanyl-D-glutamate--2,6-diaminopimelate ligase [Oscillospiraceae bacterium]
MKLYALLEQLKTALPDTEITGVTDDSRAVEPGMLFVCVKGGHFDGHDKAAEVLEKGAAAVVCERDLGLGDRQILTENTRKTYGDLCAAWYGHPERAMQLIGITGTNGKTTTATLIKEMLKKAGKKVGLIGTVQYEIGDEILPSVNTTPLTGAFFSLLRKMADAGCETVVMEVSSFGLEQYRIGPAHFAAAVFTNLTQDHLDIHGTMENYYQAKRMLFDRCDFAVINANDDYGKRLYSEIGCRKCTYGIRQTAADSFDACAEDISLSTEGTEFTLTLHGKTQRLFMRMTGMFNVSNAVAAIAVGTEIGIPDAVMTELLLDYTGVRGRCEVIPTALDFTVICDYAHTPDALEKTLLSLRECTVGRLIAVFGCGGNRDAAKRPKMARAAANIADMLVITSDNPRDEDPLQIIQDILKGLEGTEIPFQTEPDRAEAVYLAMRQAKTGDVVVLAGKGHEDYQIIAGGVHLHMDERELVADAAKRIFAERT